jgi:hypothetical protein
MDSPLARAVLSRHAPREWSATVPKREVLQELQFYHQEFDYVKDKIRQTLEVEVDRVFRVENPYLYGEYIVQK